MCQLAQYLQVSRTGGFLFATSCLLILILRHYDKAILLPMHAQGLRPDIPQFLCMGEQEKGAESCSKANLYSSTHRSVGSSWRQCKKRLPSPRLVLSPIPGHNGQTRTRYSSPFPRTDPCVSLCQGATVNKSHLALRGMSYQVHYTVMK